MTPAPEKAVADAAATAPKPSSLESVLSTMDDASEKFRSAQADLNSQQYQKVVDETDVQKGKVYFRRKNKELEMKLDIAQPESKYVLVKEGKAQLYQPGIDQVTEYSIASKEEAEGMFALGVDVRLDGRTGIVIFAREIEHHIRRAFVVGRA